MGPGQTDTSHDESSSTGFELAQLTADDIDSLFDALSHDDRRVLLVNLLDTGKADACDLLPDGHTTRAKTKLRHIHLPKLEDCGYIEWDRETNTVAPGPKFGRVESLLTDLSAVTA